MTDEQHPDRPNEDNASPRVAVAVSPSAKAKIVKRKWLYLVGGGAVFVIIASVVMGGAPRALHVAAAPQKPISLTPPGVVQQSFAERTQAAITALKSMTDALKSDQAATHAQIEKLQDAQNKFQSNANENFTKLSNKIGLLQGLLKDLKAPLPPADRSVPGGKVRASAGGSGDGNVNALPVVPPPLPSGEDAATQPQPETQPLSNPDAPVVLTPPPLASSKPTVSMHYTKNPYAGYLPPGGFAPGVLLTGVEAGTAAAAQSNPQPVMVRVQRNAILPGDARYRVQTCFAIGSAYGSLSAQRAYIRLASLSCVDKHRHLVLDAKIQGYVVDSDGMFGLRGTLVERRGALLAKTFLAGFASGLSGALGQANGGMAAGSSVIGSLPSTSQLTRAAGLEGASTAANQLASFYLKEAESIFPVIEVPPKRKLTLVLVKGVSLAWHDYGPLYVRQVKPVGAGK